VPPTLSSLSTSTSVPPSGPLFSFSPPFCAPSPFALVICPTRELAYQVWSSSLRSLFIIIAIMPTSIHLNFTTVHIQHHLYLGPRPPPGPHPRAGREE
jgi:hypothetical protein